MCPVKLLTLLAFAIFIYFQGICSLHHRSSHGQKVKYSIYQLTRYTLTSCKIHASIVTIALHSQLNSDHIHIQNRITFTSKIVSQSQQYHITFKAESNHNHSKIESQSKHNWITVLAKMNHHRRKTESQSKHHHITIVAIESHSQHHRTTITWQSH